MSHCNMQAEDIRTMEVEHRRKRPLLLSLPEHLEHQGLEGTLLPMPITFKTCVPEQTGPQAVAAQHPATEWGDRKAYLSRPPGVPRQLGPNHLAWRRGLQDLRHRIKSIITCFSRLMCVLPLHSSNRLRPVCCCCADCWRWSRFSQCSERLASCCWCW